MWETNMDWGAPMAGFLEVRLSTLYAGEVNIYWKTKHFAWRRRGNIGSVHKCKVARDVRAACSRAKFWNLDLLKLLETCFCLFLHPQSFQGWPWSYMESNTFCSSLRKVGHVPPCVPGFYTHFTNFWNRIYGKRVGQVLLSRVYYKAHIGWTRRHIFIVKGLRLLENALLRLVFANSVFHKRDILLICEAEFTESVA